MKTACSCVRATSAGRGRCAWFALLAHALFAPQTTAFAQTELFVEDFESGSPDAWSSYFSGHGPACAPQYAIDFCRLQFPSVIDGTEGTQVTVYGRLYVAGLTDIGSANDPASQIQGDVGYGPDGSDPAIDSGWVWVTATPNPGYDGSFGGEPNNDEYMGAFAVPSTSGSPYDFAYRFSGDCGASFTVCDGGDAGSSDGYSAADAGQMISNPAPP